MESRSRFALVARFAVALAAIAGLGLPLDAAARKPSWIAAWGTSLQGPAPATTVVTDQTVRLIARPTVSGSFVRVRLENTFGTAPLTIGAASVAVRDNGAQLVPGTAQPLTVGGATAFTIPAGAGVTTDAVPFPVQAWHDLAVSLHVPGTSVPVSRHNNARKTSYRTPQGSGNHTADEAATAFTETMTEMWWLAAVDVFSGAKGAVVFLGDSITDGTATTTDGHDRWHDVAFLRQVLGPSGEPHRAFVNEGIGGNRVTVTATQGSPAALERLDRDVLARSGISHVVFFEGTNDLASGLVDADHLIAGMKEVIARVKARGLPIVGATIIPRSNATWTAQMTAYRHQVNDWIRKDAGFDGVIDFDAVMKDATNPDVMNPLLDFGDHIHPSPYGYFLMGQAVPLSLLEGP